VPEQRYVVFADYVCPFSRLAEAVLSRCRSDGVGIDMAAFELRPPGTPLPRADAVHGESWERLITPLAHELGVMMNRPPVVSRTRKAHEAAAYARSVGRFAELHAAIHAAYWEEGRDIGRIDVLVDIGREIGLDATALRVALDIDQWTDEVERQERWAAQLGVDAVPAYVRLKDEAGTAVATDIRIGLQRYEELRAWMGTDHDL